MKLAENIDIDFDHELKFSPFPFKEVILSDIYFIDILKQDYLQAPLQPKPYLYLREFFTDKEWEQDRAESHARTRTASSNSHPIAAGFVPDTPLETLSKRLTEEFFNMAVARTLEEKYYGRRILETTLAKHLKQIADQLDVFKQYAIDHTDVTSYQAYARAASKSIVKELGKIHDLKLRTALLEEMLAADIDTELTILMVVKKLTEPEKNSARKRFIILKAYADEILQETKDQLLSSGENDRLATEEITISTQVIDRGHGYYDWPDRFFSYDLNNYQFAERTAPGNIKEQFRLRQIVLETKFLHAFKSATADTLKALLDEQFELTLARKEDFLNYVEIIGNANLKSSFQGASIKKADVFRVWIKDKRGLLPESQLQKQAEKDTGSLFLEPLRTSQFLEILKKVEPPILNEEGHYRLGERSKSAIVAWFDILDRAGKIRTGLTAGKKTELVNQLIPGLNIDKRSFGNTHKRAFKDYHHQLETLIKKL